MEASSLFRRSASRCLASSNRPRLADLANQGACAVTGSRHKATAARQRRALRIKQADSFLGDDSSQDTIVFNPPSSAPTVLSTPFKFLPSTDPRRRHNLQNLFSTDNTIKYSTNTPSPIAPLLRPANSEPETQARTILTKDQVLEMRQMRADDPHGWDVVKLAKHFNVPNSFVMHCTQADKAKREFEEERLAKAKAKWGPIRVKAKEDRQRRYEMLMRGEI